MAITKQQYELQQKINKAKKIGSYFAVLGFALFIGPVSLYMAIG